VAIGKETSQAFNITAKKKEVDEAIDKFNTAFKKLFERNSIENIMKFAQPILDKFGHNIEIELKKYNQTFIEQIEETKDTEALLQVWEQMKAKSFLNYNVDIKKQDEHLEEFKALSLAEQKQHLCELLDKNQLYVNLSSLNDVDFACTAEEKKVTQNFYQIKK
jgi:hypothetical protein